MRAYGGPDPVSSARLSNVLRKLGPSRTVVSREASRAGDPIAALLSTAAPLPGPRRVPRSPDVDGLARRSSPAFAAACGPFFVVTFDGDDVEGFREDLGPAALEPLRRLDWVPQERLDLHGTRARVVARALQGLVRECARRGVGRLLVIHGKGLHSKGGVGVMGEIVREALVADEVAPFVRAFRTVRGGLGGAGALGIELDLRF